MIDTLSWHVDFMKWYFRFGEGLAAGLSFATNSSILWAIFHAYFGWYYVIYWIFFGRN